jgi:hypothetical protein
MQTDKLVLTPSQQSMLNATIRDPVDPPYLLQLVLAFTPDVTEPNWRAAWHQVVTAHPLLRMAYISGIPSITPADQQPE